MSVVDVDRSLHLTALATVSSACAAERDSLTLSTFANFSQREQWKFKQSNVNELIVTLLFLNFLKYFFRTNYLFLSEESSADVPCEGCLCTASGTQHRN